MDRECGARSRKAGTFLSKFLALVMVLAGALPAAAAGPAIAWRPSSRRMYPAKVSALVMDGETGQVLYSWKADAERHPASLTKLMTLYLLFDALKHGKLKLDSELTFSAHAAGQAATNLHVAAGARIRVDDAIRALIVHSANDVAVAIAEQLGGTELHFAQMMTAQARQLGMRNTFFHNATGLPDPLQITTATDLAILARHVAYDYPEYFHFFSTTQFVYRGVHYRTFDRLLGHYRGADGMKTGYIGASGFNLVSSVVRDGVHIIAVVMGGRSEQGRDQEMMRLLDAVFAGIASHPSLVARRGVPWIAASATEPVPTPRPVAVTAKVAVTTKVAVATKQDWTIQIGAFKDAGTAHARLASYAEKAGPLLKDADPIIAPFEAVGGHTLYRARFGSFGKLEARQLCDSLMEHGQTCFTAQAR